MNSLRGGAIATAVAVASLAAAHAARAVPCPVVTYDNYLAAGFSCSVGSLTFSDFSYTNSVSGGATPVPASSITVNPIGPFDPGFRFAFGAFADIGQTNDLLFDFTVTGVDIEDAFAAVVGGQSGNGVVTLDETLDVPALLSASIPGSPTDHVTFSPRSKVSVLGKDLFLGGGSVVGSNARASAVIDRFSVPEPTSIVLLGFGILGLGIAFRRR